MKALILKDLFNIGSHIRSTLIVFLLLALCLLPSTGAMGYVFMLTIMCSTMNLSTFSYDEASHWTGYALTMPVSRRDVVAAKFVTLGVFTLMGTLAGFAIGAVGEIALNKAMLSGKTLAELSASSCLAFGMGMMMGGTAMPMVFRFGAERARVFTFLSALLPAALVALVYLGADALGLALTDTAICVLMALSPLAALAWDVLMACICLRIFSAQDVK